MILSYIPYFMHISRCPTEEAVGGLSITQSFTADADHVPTGKNNPNGSEWYIVSGVIHATRWHLFDGSSPQNTLYIRCSVKLGITPEALPLCKKVSVNMLTDKPTSYQSTYLHHCLSPITCIILTD